MSPTYKNDDEPIIAYGNEKINLTCATTSTFLPGLKFSWKLNDRNIQRNMTTSQSTSSSTLTTFCSTSGKPGEQQIETYSCQAETTGSCNKTVKTISRRVDCQPVPQTGMSIVNVCLMIGSILIGCVVISGIGIMQANNYVSFTNIASECPCLLCISFMSLSRL
jgi:hypothetical protein